MCRATALEAFLDALYIRQSCPDMLIYRGQIQFRFLAGSLLVALASTRGISQAVAQPSLPELAAPGRQVVSPSELHGKGRIYLLQLGPHTGAYSVGDLAEWLGRKYSIEVQVLPAADLGAGTLDEDRHMYIAERLIQQIQRDHPALAVEPNSWLIGFTDAGMYSAEDGDVVFSEHDLSRTAIISSHDVMTGCDPDAAGPCSTTAPALVDRLRRILLKDVAVLFWNLPMNNDPASVLYSKLDLDVPGTEIYKSDLNPVTSEWGESLNDPCIIFTYSAQQGVKLSVQNGRLFLGCWQDTISEQSWSDTPNARPDTGEERMLVRLATGTVVQRHMDFYIPGPVPISFERANGVEWLGKSSFGLNGGHIYDAQLSSGDQMATINVVNATDWEADLVRVPKDLPTLALIKWVDSKSGNNLQLRWRETPSPHFYLTHLDGAVESYMPCAGSEMCLLNGYQDGHGHELTMKRDAKRRLTDLSSAKDSWLHLSYHETSPQCQRCISEIHDSLGHKILYSYDSQGRLVDVTYPSGEHILYGYDELQHLTSVSVSQAGDTQPPTVLVTNKFEYGKLSSQTFADSSVYTYHYSVDKDGNVESATVHTPQSVFYTSFQCDGANIREQPPAQNPEPATLP